jgi:hypothetical protein
MPKSLVALDWEGAMTYKELLASKYIDELAEVFDTGGAAKGLLDKAGIPRSNLTPFDAGSPIHYWQEVCRKLDSGLVEDGLKKLVATAAESFPGNAVLAEFARRITVDPGSPMGPIRVLFLAANPLKTKRLRVDAEERTLLEVGQRSRAMKRRIDVERRPAVQPKDLVPALQAVKPTVVHFAGHGEEKGGIVLDDGRGGKKVVPFEALGNVFRLLTGDDFKVRCVVLNGCFTADAIAAIGDSVDAIVGSSSSIADDSALEFARGFYTAIAEGRPVGAAVKRGKLEMGLEGPMPPMRSTVLGVFDPENIVATGMGGINLEELYL